MNRFTLLAAAVMAAVSTGVFAQDAQTALGKIQASNTIAIGHRETSVPFSYVDANNEVIGFSQDICNRVIDAVKAKVKKPDLKVRFIPVTSQKIGRAHV